MNLSPINIFLRVPHEIACDSRQKTRYCRRQALSLLLLSILTAGTFLPILRRMVDNVVLQERTKYIPLMLIAPPTDYAAHSALVELMRREKRLTVPHPLYHLLVLGVQQVYECFSSPPRLAPKDATDIAIRQAAKVAPGSRAVLVTLVQKYRVSVLIVGITCLQFTAILIYLFLRRIFPASCPAAWPEIASVSFAWASMIVAPLFLFAHNDHLFYLGYIGVNVLHNPTMLLVKPLAFVWFLWGVYAIRDRSGSDDARVPKSPDSTSWTTICGVGMLGILATLAKPSFSICIVPALAFMTLWQIMTGRSALLRCKLLFFGTIFPATLILMGQFFWQYGQPKQVTSGPTYSIAFQPLGAVRSWSEHVLWKGWLSIVFPLIVTLLFPKSVWQSIRLKLAWLVFFISASQFYLLSEEGREGNGNFTWGAQIALFILFISCLELILGRLKSAAEACALGETEKSVIGVSVE